MMWDGITTAVFTLLTSGILTYIIADKPIEGSNLIDRLRNLFIEAPNPNPEP